MTRVYQLIIFIFWTGFLVGCGGNNVGDTTGGNKDALVEIGEMLKSLNEEGRKAPASQADLGTVEPMLPLAGPLIRDGNIIVIWGANFSARSQQIVAYEKKAPTDGGFVLLQDGTVKQMSAVEFGAAPKFKK